MHFSDVYTYDSTQTQGKKGVDVWIGQYDIKTAVMLTFVNEIKVGLPDDDS